MLALKAPGQGSLLRAWGNNAYRNSNHLPKKFFLEEGMKKPCKILRGRAQFTRREGEQGEAVSENFCKKFFKKIFSRVLL